MRFSKQKSIWLKSRASRLGGYVKMKDVGRNKTAEVFYKKSLQKEFDRFVKKAFDDISSTLMTTTAVDVVQKELGVIHSTKLKILEKNADKIVTAWLSKAKKFSKNDITEIKSQFFGKDIAINYDKDIYEATFKSFIDRNVNLITNAGSQTLTDIQNIVYDAMTTGAGIKEIREKISQQKDIAQRRVKLIAADQTNKANAALNQIAQEEAGIEYFEWWGMDDSRERSTHCKLNGKIFKWRDDYSRLPLIDDKGNRGYPAQAIRCRCRAVGVEILEGYEAVWNNGSQSYEIKKKKNV